ncbi:MAG: hypothetical protein Q9161_007122 [Pseudevernia consocians]
MAPIIDHTPATQTEEPKPDQQRATKRPYSTRYNTIKSNAPPSPSQAGNTHSSGQGRQ